MCDDGHCQVPFYWVKMTRSQGGIQESWENSVCSICDNIQTILFLKKCHMKKCSWSHQIKAVSHCGAQRTSLIGTQTHPHTISALPLAFECCWKQSDSQEQNLHSRLWARENLNRQITHFWKWSFILETVGHSKSNKMNSTAQRKCLQKHIGALLS